MKGKQALSTYDDDTINTIENLEEMTTMLSERLDQWHEEAIQKGVHKGKLEGEVTVLLRLLELKFGSVTDDMRQRIMAADSDTILTWSERILTAQTPEEVVG